MSAIVLLAGLGFTLSLAVHIATFFPGSPLLALAAPLNVALCVVWSPLLWIGTRRLFDITAVGDRWAAIPRHAPEWGKGVGAALLAYAVINFLVSMLALNRGGFPAVVDGEAVLQTYNFGVVLARLTPEEFARHQAYTVRASSGHWLFFFWMGALAAHSHLRERALRRAAPAPAPAREEAPLPAGE